MGEIQQLAWFWRCEHPDCLYTWIKNPNSMKSNSRPHHCPACHRHSWYTGEHQSTAPKKVRVRQRDWALRPDPADRRKVAGTGPTWLPHRLVASFKEMK